MIKNNKILVLTALFLNISWINSAYSSNIGKRMINIDFEDFAKVNFRIGTIIKARDFPKARNPSYQIDIDFGCLGQKSSSAQLPANYKLDDLKGKQILGVTNLPIRKIAGFKSEILVVGFPDEKNNVSLLNNRFYKVKNGSSLIKQENQFDEIIYEDFEKIDIRSATILSLKPIETDLLSFHVELDVGEYGKRVAFFGDTSKEIINSLLGSQVAAIINMRSACIMDNGYNATILTFFALEQEKIIKIPFGIDKQVQNGMKLF